MTPQQRRQARIELWAAEDALARISELTGEGRERYDLEADRRAHLRYLWIVAGSRLKNHSTVLGITRAAGGFAPAIALRNKLAYTAPGRIDDGQVWVTSVEDAPVLANRSAPCARFGGRGSSAEDRPAPAVRATGQRRWRAITIRAANFGVWPRRHSCSPCR
ncbi:MAG: hypothetical protein WEB03_16180 [Nitriliruptor sp.]|uniref:hypothetical protein n=1 Tax=Nitriliruptor sp. TaxID=2448056 RepID=UPI00349FE8DD